MPILLIFLFLLPLFLNAGDASGRIPVSEKRLEVKEGDGKTASHYLVSVFSGDEEKEEQENDTDPTSEGGDETGLSSAARFLFTRFLPGCFLSEEFASGSGFANLGVPLFLLFRNLRW